MHNAQDTIQNYSMYREPEKCDQVSINRAQHLHNPDVGIITQGPKAGILIITEINENINIIK